MRMRRDVLNASVFAFLLFLMVGTSAAANPADRIVTSVNESDLVQLGGTHRLALAKYDQGPVADSLRMDHMFVVLQRSPEQEQAVERLAAELQDPHSANYHKWLTAEELGKKFGPAPEDIEAVVSWLSSHGLQVNLVHKSGMTIDVSGTAGQVGEAFHTEIHRYNVNGEQHIANATDPKIPAALAPVVAGVSSLNDFLPKALIKKPKSAFSYYCEGCPTGFTDTSSGMMRPRRISPQSTTLRHCIKRTSQSRGKGRPWLSWKSPIYKQRMWPHSARLSVSPLIRAPSAKFIPALAAPIQARTARRGSCSGRRVGGRGRSRCRRRTSLVRR
jgi:hypothetical protein